MSNLSVEQLWADAWAKHAEGVDLSKARVAGRATKAFPNKEDVTFWNTTGPQWVNDYIAWRKANHNWKIWTTPQGAPAIELGLTPTFAGVTVKMFIDRVFEVDGQLVVVDLKTSRTTPTSALQLAFYRLGLKQILGVDIQYGAYWMARQGGTSAMIDLTSYTEDKIEYLLSGFDKARKAGIFIPNTNNCNRCGLTEFCEFSTKKETNNE